MDVSPDSAPPAATVPSRPPWQRLLLTAAAALPALVVLGVTAWHYRTFIADDALISLRYARRVLDGDGLTWTDGERVEGYSNLLWTLACAALGATGLDLVRAARALGLFCGGAAIAAVLAWRPPARLRDAVPPLVAALALVLARPLPIWAMGGLEQPLVAALLAWALVAARRLVDEPAAPETARTTARRVLPAAVPLALLCWTRPDGPLLVAAIALAVAAARPGLASLERAVALGLPAAAAVGLQLAFRLVYYGDFVPNPARVKVALTSQRVLDGLGYVWGGSRALSGLLLLAALALVPAVLDAGYRRRALLLALPALAWTAYLTFVGGDIFPAHRHLVVPIVCAALLVADGLSWALDRPRLVAASAGVAAAGLVAWLGVRQAREPENDRAFHERWEWDGAVVGTVLKQAFGPARPLLAVDPAGCVPYFSELPSLDMLGLNDRWLATHPPPGFGTGPLAHELGDGAYVLSRRPDLVLLCIPGGSDKGCFRGGRELLALREFRAQFALVQLEGTRPHRLRARIWARREGGAIGIRREGPEVLVPGHLLATLAPAVLDGQGRLGTRATPAEPARIERLQLPAGTWRATAEAGGDPWSLRVRRAGALLAEGPEVVFQLAGKPLAVDVEVAPAAGQAHVRGITLRRVEEAGAQARGSR